ncbi:hypothetical protein N8T08_003228 [Aspergillus melleus]|uniref:Uncharacterized protein n=1 Tax=Aspergillus melleus TaxID=138277 RepID=A0ACC3B725_9EURO|nr:hypothetical protein N8T08_003228 [Aspergillus melleus]
MDKISINPPLEEDAPGVPFPYGDEIFYYDQVDIVRAVSKDKSWGFTEVRPDQILGFVPNVSGMTYVEPIALYLSLYRYVHGADSEVPFPGTFKNYVYTSTDTSQNVLSKAEIYLSIMTPDSANEQAFNVADTSDPGSWSRKWPF